ncbi:transmembrane protein 8B isoform X2 [Cephus cinctus]|uniref:Transmembrane protein 8B isoform X2 n=1 Tax=Cephus cinctus TaxID=211228 RepID=A0AAJ7FGT8_CEPCN|nr:transmembrane protein 8B isoform X2 [Cephus cinctus]
MPKREIAPFLIWSLIIQLGLSGNTERISQHPSNILVDFFAYRHISIVHFNIPQNSVAATFKFIAKEERTGGLGRCSTRDVSVYLKFGSLPLVRPDNSTIAAKLLQRRYSYYNLEILSDETQHLIRVDAPPPGDWYAIAFRSWSDPNKEQISQQGIGPSCDTILEAELFIERPTTVSVIDSTTEHWTELDSTSNSAVVQFLISKLAYNTTLAVKSTCGNNCTIGVNVSTLEHLAEKVFRAEESEFTFRPYINSFHYVLLRLVSGESSNVSLTLDTETIESNSTDVKFVKLLRRSFPDFFLFDYENLQGNDTKSSPYNLTNESLTVLQFEIGSVYDVGGTVSVGLKLPDTEIKDKNVIVVSCISHGYYIPITDTASCENKRTITPPDIYVNKTGPSYIHIPYPEPGQWYISLKSFCVEEKCDCAEECLTSVCQECSCLKECSSRVESNVASSPCIDAKCNSNGRCVHYMSGGFIFSACHCTDNYRGFDCADDTYVLGKTKIIISLVLLTSSNLAFIGAIYLALSREYYTEAIVYTAVMLSSTFYHACEAGEDVYSLCIMRLSVLQFCDFFNALLSIWVTLVAMAAFGYRLTGFCQMAGAIILAMGAEMDRTALWVFLLPALTGSALVVISWGMKCRIKKTFRYPSRPYQTLFLPAGLALVFIALMCYAFLQTRQNYYIIHSVWHILMAVGVMLLLPRREYMK